jgi:hypothetical protein
LHWLFLWSVSVSLTRTMRDKMAKMGRKCSVDVSQHPDSTVSFAVI